ncbi:MAG: universal stress protein [Litoreibacter sp.]|nr:universal stress protein [Litoreibacter sp.]
MYKRILTTSDGSELAEKAVAHGVALAKAVGAELYCVTVTEVWSALEIARDVESGKTDPVEEYEAAAAEFANETLEKAQSIAGEAGMEMKTIHVPDKGAADGIMEAATEQGCDLIVMASHGRRGLGRMLLGSQTAEVLAFSKIPVLVPR